MNSLLDLGCKVTVWCCKPSNAALEDEEIEMAYPYSKGRLQIITTAVSASKCRCLDDNSAWKEFVHNKNDVHAFLTKSMSESADSLLPIAIDWHGAHAFESLLESEPQFFSPLLYMNFRVYSAGIQDSRRHTWLDEMEKKALKQAGRIVALSEHDRTLLQRLGEFSDKGEKKIEVVYPPLRKEVHSLATAAINSNMQLLPPLPKALPNGKRFVTCVVRLSREKETLRFLAFLQCCKDILDDKELVPVIVGSPSDEAYANQVRTGLRELCPFAIDLVDTFLSPSEMCALFARTVLNFHPCSYDAYGMTIVEAAAMAVPSVIANNGKVGASHLVQDACVSITMPPLPISDVNSDETARIIMLPEPSIQRLRSMLADETKLQELGSWARSRALAWSESAYGKALIEASSSIGN